MALPSLFQTPEDYLLQMITAVSDAGSALTDFTIGSVTRNFYEGLATGLSAQSGVVEQFRQDSYLSTATGDALDAIAANNGVQRNAATLAAGTVRIIRSGSGLQAATIPAGWGPLATVPAPGQPSLTYVTTEDAVFPAGTGPQTVDVAGQSVLAGAANNINQAGGATTPVIAVNPVAGFSSLSSFFLLGPWVGAVDAETDDQLRVRVPLDVAGRVKGREEAFLAAALRIAGVTSAQVLKPGDSGPHGTVAGGHVEVYYQGSSSLLSDVTTEVLGAQMLGQTVSVYTAAATSVLIDVTVLCKAGTDTGTLQTDAEDALRGLINACPVGGTVRESSAIQALHSIQAVAGVTLPPSLFVLAVDVAGVEDLAAPNGTYLSIVQDADLTVVVTPLP